MTRMLDLRHIWNVIYNARPIREWSETIPIMIRAWNRQSATRRANRVTFRAPDEHFLLKNITFRAPAIIPNSTKYCACHEKWHLTFTKYCPCHEKCHLTFTKYCACHEKVTLELHQVLPLSRRVTLDLHEVLRLPHRMTRMLHPRHIWNVIYNARSNQCHHPDSPNIAPATQNDRPTSDRN